MSSTCPNTGGSSAEAKFRGAFERLKAGKPLNIAHGSRVTQNNVAREAGAVPSALRAARFPVLVNEIRLWITEQRQSGPQASAHQERNARRRRVRDLRERITQLVRQRDDAVSKLVCAEARIVELTLERERLLKQVPKSNVTPLRDTRGRNV